MRSLRITIGLAVAVMAMALIGGTASAAEPALFGEFVASVSGGTITPATPAIARSHESEIEEFAFGGIKGIHCKKFTTVGEVTAERSTELNVELQIKGCKYKGHSGIFTHQMGVSFRKPLKLDLHANGSAKVVGIGANETELVLHGFKCSVKIPAQELPLAAEKSPNKEYETIEYGSERVEVEGSKLKKFPSGFYEELEITYTLKNIRIEYEPEEGGKEASHCGYIREEGGAYNPETGMVEAKMQFDAESDEIRIKNGSIGFEPA